MTVGKKIGWGFGAILLFLVLLAGMAYVYIGDIDDGANSYAKSAELDRYFADREVDHLNWVLRLQSLFAQNLDKIELQVDPHKCGLGLFLYGERCAVMTQCDPHLGEKLEAIKPPHEVLHRTAEKITRIWKKRHTGLQSMLKSCYIEHLQASAILERFITTNKVSSGELVTQDDLTLFGKFFSSQDFDNNAKTFPQHYVLIEKIREPHTRLMVIRREIIELLTKGKKDAAVALYHGEFAKQLTLLEELVEAVILHEDSAVIAQAEALKIFNNEIIPTLAKIREHLLNIRVEVNVMTDSEMVKLNEADRKLSKNVDRSKISPNDAAAMESTEKLDKTLKSSRRNMQIISIIGVIVGVLLAWFMARDITGKLRVIVNGLNDGSTQISAAAAEIASASQSLAEGASEQASSLEETSASLEEITSMTRQNTDNARQANNVAVTAQDAAKGGGEVIERMSASIEKIKASSDQTAKIVKTIDEIAFQTNLLALNAAVEAARAGEAGKGFAVVAEEVRNLAQRSAEAAKNTSGLIEESQKNSEQGVAISSEVTAVLARIGADITKVGTLNNEVATASEEQTKGIEQINTAVSQLDQLTQTNAATAEESAAASEELSAQAAELANMMHELAKMVGVEVKR